MAKTKAGTQVPSLTPKCLCSEEQLSRPISGLFHRASNYKSDRLGAPFAIKAFFIIYVYQSR